MVYIWNNHNYDDMVNYTTENNDWMNIVGMWWKGRKESQYAHQVFHNTFLKTTVCDGKWLLTAVKNVHIDKGAEPFDPVKQMTKE